MLLSKGGLFAADELLLLLLLLLFLSLLGDVLLLWVGEPFPVIVCSGLLLVGGELCKDIMAN